MPDQGARGQRRDHHEREAAEQFRRRVPGVVGQQPDRHRAEQGGQHQRAGHGAERDRGVGSGQRHQPHRRHLRAREPDGEQAVPDVGVKGAADQPRQRGQRDHRQHREQRDGAGVVTQTGEVGGGDAERGGEHEHGQE